MTDGEIREKFKNVNGRLKRVEDKVDKQDEILVSINNLTTQMDIMNKELATQREDINTIKEQPLERNKTIRNAVITAVVSAVVGGVIGFLITFLCQL